MKIEHEYGPTIDDDEITEIKVTMKLPDGREMKVTISERGDVGIGIEPVFPDPQLPEVWIDTYDMERDKTFKVNVYAPDHQGFCDEPVVLMASKGSVLIHSDEGHKLLN